MTRALRSSLGWRVSPCYAATAAPSVATLFDDSLEFQVVLPTLGIAHPSGYPLYTLLGKLFTLLLPFRDPPGAPTCCRRSPRGPRWACSTCWRRRSPATGPPRPPRPPLFALSPAWWTHGHHRRVYALHGLFVVLFLYLLLRWEEARVQETGCRGQGTGVREHTLGQDCFRRQSTSADGPIFQLPATSLTSDRWLAAAALVFGLGMTHHRMIALMLPAALVLIFWTDPALIRQPRRWLVPLLCTFTPLLFVSLPARPRADSHIAGRHVRAHARRHAGLGHGARLQHLSDGEPVRGGTQRQFDHRSFSGSMGVLTITRPR